MTFQLRNLIPEETYNLAVYLSSSLKCAPRPRGWTLNTRVLMSRIQNSAPAFSMPGLANQDYLLFEDLQPLDFGDGSAGLLCTISYDGPFASGRGHYIGASAGGTFCP